MGGPHTKLHKSYQPQSIHALLQAYHKLTHKPPIPPGSSSCCTTSISQRLSMTQSDAPGARRQRRKMKPGAPAGCWPRQLRHLRGCRAAAEVGVLQRCRCADAVLRVKLHELLQQVEALRGGLRAARSGRQQPQQRERALNILTQIHPRTRCMSSGTGTPASQCLNRLLAVHTHSTRTCRLQAQTQARSQVHVFPLLCRHMCCCASRFLLLAHLREQLLQRLAVCWLEVDAVRQVSHAWPGLHSGHAQHLRRCSTCRCSRTMV